MKTRLERLTAEHEAAVLAFERTNREYFSRFISDRGDAYFAEFPARHRALLAEQDSGEGHFHLIYDEAELVGRINLICAEDDVAMLGYRVAERAAGKGVATSAVAELCQIAATDYRLVALVADASVENQASRVVLERNGFELVGESTVGAGRPAVRYRRALDAAMG
jgi:ribosomal-protein-alanine N-acetyltransferase